MVIYIFIYLVLSILALLSANSSRKSQNVMGWMVLVAVCLFQGLRWRTGTDWIPYYDVFIYANSRDPISNMEPGYLVLNKLIKSFTSNYSVFLLITCFLRLWLFARAAKYFGVSNIAAILLVCFSAAIFPVRIHLAVAIYFNAYKYIVEKNFVKYLFVVFLAASVHMSALFALPFYLLSLKSFSYRTLIIVYIGACFLGYAVEPILESVNNFVMLGLFDSSEFAVEKISGNLEGTMEYGRSFVSVVMSLINGAFFVSLFCFIRQKYFREDKKYDVLLFLYVFGLAFNRLFINAIPSLTRAVEFFSCGFSIMLLLCIARQTPKTRPFFLTLIVIYYFFIFKRLPSIYTDLFVPYYSVFSDVQRVSVY